MQQFGGALLKSTAIVVTCLSLSACAVSTGQWYDSEKNRPPGFFARITQASTKSPKSIVPAGSVRVEKGDSYYIIANRYGVSLNALLRANKARPPYALKTGQILRLPKPKTHLVAKGDTLFSIARRYDVRVSEIASINRLRSPYTISVGTKLSLPSGSRLAATGKASRVSAAAGSTSTRQTSIRPEVVRTAPPARKGRFLKPLTGTIISRYGPKAGGLHNDGINIAAPLGHPIKAAENGVVIYAGNELRGYGNLILIRHSNGWVTAYAHASRFKVRPGDKVKQGQVIGLVGQSGNVDKPQLHFEIRKNSRAIDPQKYIS